MIDNPLPSYGACSIERSESLSQKPLSPKVRSPLVHPSPVRTSRLQAHGRTLRAVCDLRYDCQETSCGVVLHGFESHPPHHLHCLFSPNSQSIRCSSSLPLQEQDSL